MYIRIKIGAYCSGNNPAFTKFLKDNEGKLVKVETKHLFNNQYNTEEFRIMDTNVSEVVNDARKGKGKCKYCGAMVDVNDKEAHAKEVECTIYGIEWFTEKNTYFLKYPQGYKKEYKDFTPQKIGTYKLEIGSEYLILRNARKNIKFRFEGGEFWVRDGIGYNKTKFLDVPYNVHEKVKKILTL